MALIRRFYLFYLFIVYVLTSCRDQLVTLTTVDPPLPVRVVGITPEHGLLRTVAANPTKGASSTKIEYIDLQPDGNSFDMFSGLIKTKL